MFIKKILRTDIHNVKTISNVAVGDGYYSIDELTENQNKSISKTGQICLFLLKGETDYSMHGIRLAYPPGNWDLGKVGQLRAELSSTKIEESWKESTNNSSDRYSNYMGSKENVEQHNYLININYVCTSDGYPCRCTAIELYLSLVPN